MEEEHQIVGVCWFQPEQWDRLKEISDDRDALEDSYEEWRRNASSTIHELMAVDQIIEKVKINLEELLIWCNEKGVLVNSESRAEYVALLMRQKYNQPPLTV